ncbi:MAG TPA: hypothetical protein VGM16_08535 [Gammaproteobacteria bacterium]|jgi:hypothetical protein
MRRLIRLLFGIAAVMLLLGASNCSKNNDSDAPQFVTTLTVQNSSGQASAAFGQGTPIEFVLTIRNRTDQPQSLFFNSDELLNVAVVDAGTATVVWNCDNPATTTTTTTAACAFDASSLSVPSSSGSGFNEMDFAAFETKTITITWNQTDDNGAQVPVVPVNPGTLTTGQYEVMGGFTVFNTTGPGQGADNGSSMAEGPPTASQLFPSVYRSTLNAFSIN